MSRVYLLHQRHKKGESLAGAVRCGSKAEAKELFQSHFGKKLAGSKRLLRAQNDYYPDSLSGQRQVEEILPEWK